jgi:hypothetical protein
MTGIYTLTVEPSVHIVTQGVIAYAELIAALAFLTGLMSASLLTEDDTDDNS